MHVVGVAMRQEELGAATEFDMTAPKRIYVQRARPYYRKSVYGPLKKPA